MYWRPSLSLCCRLILNASIDFRVVHVRCEAKVVAHTLARSSKDLPSIYVLGGTFKYCGGVFSIGLSSLSNNIDLSFL